VDNECTLYISIVLAIGVSEIIKFGGDLTMSWQKQVGSFFWHTLYLLFAGSPMQARQSTADTAWWHGQCRATDAATKDSHSGVSEGSRPGTLC